MDMPPTRFRVVERDRRLVVIDTASGEAAGAAPPAVASGGVATKLRAVAASAGLSLPTRTRFDGTVSLTTHGWYDDKGPRTVTLDPGAVQIVKLVGAIAIAVTLMFVVFAPGLLFAPLALLVPGIAVPLRQQLTRLLDRYAP